MTSFMVERDARGRWGLSREISDDDYACRRDAQLAPSLAWVPKKAVASAACQQLFNGLIAKFRAALKANDAAAE